jgi:hypothetical protein
MPIHYFAWICGVVQERADSFVWAYGFGAFALTKAQIRIKIEYDLFFCLATKERIPIAIGTRLPILSTQKLQQ